MKKIIEVVLFGIILLNSCKAQKTCIINAKVISWTAMTKNRITEEKIKDAGFNYLNKKINSDSLSYYISKLVVSKDTLYNIRFFCSVVKHTEAKEIYVDKNGVIKINKKHYSKNVPFVRFLLKNIVTDNKSEFFPYWLNDGFLLKRTVLGPVRSGRENNISRPRKADTLLIPIAIGRGN